MKVLEILSEIVGWEKEKETTWAQKNNFNDLTIRNSDKQWKATFWKYAESTIS